MKKLWLLVVFLFAAPLIAEEGSGVDTASFPRSKKLQVVLTSVSLEKYGEPKDDRTFRAGETVFINIEVQGFRANDQQKAVFQVDLSIPQLSLDSKNIIDGSIDYDKTIPMYFKIPIESISRGGTCYAKITIRDMISKTYTVFNTTFKLAQ